MQDSSITGSTKANPEMKGIGKGIEIVRENGIFLWEKTELLPVKKKKLLKKDSVLWN